MRKKRKIVHLQLPARSRLTVARFYAGLFGWELHDQPDLEYTRLGTDNSELDIGVLQATDERPGTVAWFIESKDIEADLHAIEARGGKVIVPLMEVPGLGQLAFFADPAGNIVGLARYTNGKKGAPPPAT